METKNSSNNNKLETVNNASSSNNNNPTTQSPTPNSTSKTVLKQGTLFASKSTNVSEPSRIPLGPTLNLASTPNPALGKNLQHSITERRLNLSEVQSSSLIVKLRQKLEEILKDEPLEISSFSSNFESRLEDGRFLCYVLLKLFPNVITIHPLKGNQNETATQNETINQKLQYM